MVYMKQLLASLYKVVIVILLIYLLEDKYQVSQWIMTNSIMYERTKEDEFVLLLREHLLEGKEDFTIQYIGDIELERFTDEFIDKAFEIDDEKTSSDFDYLKYNIKSIYTRIKGFGNNINVTYQIVYNESIEETKQLDREIEGLLKEWKVSELSQYDIVKKVHDYIINNASYDKSLTKYSAYQNLFDKSSTCQGYASLAYKMITEANIPTRIITGTADGQSHGWNIVNLNDKWYNLDLTWDDPLTMDGRDIIVYDYFLKTDEEFKSHTRDNEFKTETFYAQYPMGDFILTSKSLEESD